MKKKHRYLFANYILKPRDRSKTSARGYISDPQNQKWDEVVGFAVGLKSKDKINNRIILDIDGQVVVKNTMNDNQDWAQLMDYFIKNYERQLVAFLTKTGEKA